MMSPTKKAPDQARLAQMYTSIIKMSSENKINAKNSWDLNLIDHMSHLVKEETSDRGTTSVNFQKASCTIDASVKIYSHRVDDTWTTSYRILENLSRNGNSEWSNEGEVEKGPARVGSKVISSRNGLTCTIEADKEKLNQVKLDSDYNADPIFHKMSLAFDEGGAKGMLMNNLRVVPGSSTLVFSTDLEIEGSIVVPPAMTEQKITEHSQVDMEKEPKIVDENGEYSIENKMEVEEEAAPLGEEQEPLAHEMIDISDILFKSGITLAGLQEMVISPTLEEYRTVLEVAPSSSGLFDTSGLDLAEFDSSIETQRVKAPIAASEVAAVYEPDDNYGCDEDVHDGNDEDNDNYDSPFYSDDNDGTHEDVTVNDNDAPRRKSLSALIETTKNPSTQKLDWNTIFSENNDVKSDDDNVESESSNSNIPLADIDVAIGNDYTFLNFSSLQSNSWAGARHWKFASTRCSTRVQAPSSASNSSSSPAVDNSKESSKANKSIAATKSQLLFQFGSEWSSNGAFDVPEESMSKHIKAHTLTTAALLKAAEIADEGAYELPVDAKLSPRDLCRLFLCNKMIVPPNALMGIMGKSKQISCVESLVSDYEDTCWGNLQPEVQEKINNFARMNVLTMKDTIQNNRRDDYEVYNDDNYDDDYDIGGNDHYHDEDSSNVKLAQKDNDPNVIGEEGGLQIRVPGMLQASRKIEKVNIGYSTISKRVNVKNLKSDIWDWIDHECPKEIVDPENADPNTDESSVKTKKTQDKKRKSTEKQQNKEQASFQSMISNVAKSNQQGEGQEISVSYYFLCLLHLANENNLKIEGQNNFADLKIKKDISF